MELKHIHPRHKRKELIDWLERISKKGLHKDEELEQKIDFINKFIYESR